MSLQSLIEATAAQVRKRFTNAEAGHDWWHTARVWHNAIAIAETEPLANRAVVELAALLHDIADAKFHGGNDELGWQEAQRWLEQNHAPADITTEVVNVVKHVSFKGGNFKAEYQSLELAIVQDADRLDAIGAVGVARAFSYGGYKGRPFYDPTVLPNLNMTKEEYRKSTAPTINHFYEKLLRLQDLMHTQKAKAMAQERHRFMELFLEQFFSETGYSPFIS